MAAENASSLLGRLGGKARQDADTFRSDAIPGLEALANSRRPVFLTDSLCVIVDFNPAAQALLHQTTKPRRGNRITALLGPDKDAEAIAYRALRRASAEGFALVEFYADSTASLSAEICVCGEGEYYLWSFEPPETTAGLNAKADSLNAMQEAPFGALQYDTNGKLLATNARMAEIFGRDTVEDTNLFSLFESAQASDLTTALRGDPGSGRTMRINGREVHVTRSMNEQGDFTAYFTPLETRRIENVSEVKRLVRLLDDAPVAVAVTDHEGIVLEANDRLASMSGGAARIGAQIGLAIRLEEREDVAKRIKEVAQGGSFGKPLDLKLTGEAGKEHSAQFHAHRILSEEGNLIFAYLMDISERKMVEQQLAQAQKMQAVGKLAGGIAHDVNNVLTAIRGHCDLLMLKQVAGDPGFGSLTQIKQQTSRAAEVIKQLLAFSRQQTMRREVVDLTELIDKTRFMLNPLVTERVQVKTSHGHDLWTTRIDKNEFQRVLMNLAVNACDAMPSGGTLTLRTRNIGMEAALKVTDDGFIPADYVMVEISDTGSGIPPEHLSKIFEPFFTTKPVGKGTGLGLSTVYGIIKQMEGFIYCDSVQGGGTTFRIYLPQYTGEATATSQAPAPLPTGSGNAPVMDLSGKGCILLVEDEEAVRSFAVKALELRGYEVRAAASGEEAIELVEEDPDGIDLVVSDVVMPEMTGPEMMRVVRKMRPEIQFLFVSGYAEEALREQTVEEEEFEFLAKPFSLKDLAVKVKEVMEAE